MIPREFHEYVASKMLEAFDAVIELRQIAVPGARSSFVKHAKERSAQVAQVFAGELDEVNPDVIPLYLTCPKCNVRHIDEGEFATKRHHTHSCQSCGLTWRPAVVATVGVAHLPGFRSSSSPALATLSDREREIRNAAEMAGDQDDGPYETKSQLLNDRRDLLALLNVERDRALAHSTHAWQRRAEEAEAACAEAIRRHDDHTRMLCDAHMAAIEAVRRERDAARAERDHCDAEGHRVERERDEARAQLAALVAAVNERDEADEMWEERSINIGHEIEYEMAGARMEAAVVALVRALAATPAALAGQVRARVLREAADMIEAEWSERLPLHTFLRWLRAHADEAEKTR